MVKGEIVFLLMMVPFAIGTIVEIIKCNGYRMAIGAFVGFVQSMGYVIACRITG